MKIFKYSILCLLLLALMGASAQSGLVSHWSFDSISQSKFKDHVSNLAAGTVYGAQSVPGISGNALYFDGIDDYARVPGDNVSPPSDISNLSEGSISLWFKVENIPLSNGIRPIFYYGKNNACNFFDAANEGLIIEVGHSPVHYGSKRLYFTIWTNGCTFPSFCYDSWNPITEGQWYHFVAVVGSNFNTGYLNGQVMTDRVYNFGNSNTHEFFSDALAHDNLWLGRGYWNSNNVYFKGAIDEVKIIDHPVVQSEVDSLFLEGSVITSVNDSNAEERILIYPNPSNGLLKLEIPSTYNFPLRIEAYSPNGALVYQSLVSNEDDLSFIDLRNISNGIYYLTISNENEILLGEKLILY